jgi:1,4-dihydroxy-6-naphthoate synthase
VKLTIGYSPCPNDTFIFDALVNKKIDTEGLDFNATLEDVETLNQWAFDGKLDITKLSFPAFFQNTEKYVLLNSGAALGKGVGPVLISKRETGLPNEEINRSVIALPGKNTTANLLFSFAYPDAKNKIFMRFDEIEAFVTSPPTPSPTGEGALGVIIHESRFTYRQKGLHKITDLGEYWQEKTGLPVPLGGIAVKRNIDKKIARKVDKLIKKSVEYAFGKYPLLPDYIKEHARELKEAVMRQHIELYVNDYSLGLGSQGRKAIAALYRQAASCLSLKSGHTSGMLFL